MKYGCRCRNVINAAHSPIVMRQFIYNWLLIGLTAPSTPPPIGETENT